MKIIVDAMGGDNAPGAPVRGALQAAKEFGLRVILVGREDAVRGVLKEEGLDDFPNLVEFVPASQTVEMCDNPATAFKDKKDSSLTVGLTLLRDGGGDAFVSAGSTGALLAGATLLVKRIRGIRRAALAPLIPTGKGKSVLIDCGANAECTPEYLLQFAFMGSYYAKRALGCKEPAVGLLNIGAEESKGTPLQRDTLALLKKAGGEGRIRFTGNVEAREAVEGAVDVIVTDGYTGNILLKGMEGTAKLLLGALKPVLKKNLLTKLAALTLKGGLKEMKKSLDSGEEGATAFLGISKPVLKAHGSSDAYAMKNAVRQAARFAESGIIADIEANIDYMRLPSGTTGEENAK